MQVQPEALEAGGGHRFEQRVEQFDAGAVRLDDQRGLGAADVTFTNPAVLSYPFIHFFPRTTTSLNAIAFDELRVGLSLPAVTPYDPNAPDLVLSKTNLSIHEADGVDAINVSLIAAPSADVRIDASCADTSIATVSPGQLTFTPGNWATPQSLSITALNDHLLRNKATTLTLAVDDPQDAPVLDALAGLVERGFEE